MEVNKTEKKSEKKEERKKLTRRQFLKDLGLFAVAGITLNKLDFLAGEIIKKTGQGKISVKDWSCLPGNSYYELCCVNPHSTINECQGGGWLPLYSCGPFIFHCDDDVRCDRDFDCWEDSDIYGCTQRRFECSKSFSCIHYNCTPQTHVCSSSAFNCQNKYEANYGG